MLKGINMSIADFYIPCVNGVYSPADPYEWKSLNISPDRGADMVCTDHLLGYDAGINLGVDYDPSHDVKNVGKNTLKACDLWSHQVVSYSPLSIYSSLVFSV